MKFITKKLLLFVAFAIILSMFMSCKTTAPAQNENTFPKSDYPSAPPAITQAELTKLDGTTLKIQDLKGKVILVNLWATWCKPCREEMPELVKLQDEHRDKGFEIIGLNIDEAEDAEMIKAFGEKMNLNYQLVKGDHDLGGEFLKISKIDAIPQSFLIDRDGKLVGVFIGGGQSSVEKIKTNVNKVVTE